MAHTPSQKTTREWPLLILAVTLVCTICIPLWQLSAMNQPEKPEDRTILLENIHLAFREAFIALRRSSCEPGINHLRRIVTRAEAAN